MTTSRDPDRLIHDFLMEGGEQLPDQVFDAVRSEIDRRRQRVVIGRWRLPDMNRIVPIGLGAAAVVVVLVAGSQLLGPASGGSGGAPSPTPSPTPVGGTVTYVSDGGTTTTKVDAVAAGPSVSGTAVTTSSRGTHTVRVECAVRDGDTWAFGGTTQDTSVPDERAGYWSAVIVRDGSPQRIGVWLSDDKVEGVGCDAWLAAVDLSTIDASNFRPVDSGALAPPPALAPSSGAAP